MISISLVFYLYLTVNSNDYENTKSILLSLNKNHEYNFFNCKIVIFVYFQNIQRSLKI